MSFMGMYSRIESTHKISDMRTAKLGVNFLPYIITMMNRFSRALKHRSYRLYFTGQVLSLCGTWMQQIAMSWLVYRLTNSAMMLAATMFLSNFPIVLLGFWSGTYADKWDKRKALIVMQCLYLGHAVVLMFLVALNQIQGWHLLIFAGVLGVINAFDIPLRQVFVAAIIPDKKDLPNAIALNSLMVNAARILGPSLAGLLLTVSSEAVCFGVNALSYVAIIIALHRIEPGEINIIKTGNKSSLHLFKEGLAFIQKDPWIKKSLLMMLIVSLCASPYASVMPMVVKETFVSGADVYGFLMSCSGVGAMLAGVLMAMRTTTRSLGKIVAFSVPVGGVGLLMFSLSSSHYLAGVSLFVVGFGLMLAAISSNTLIQSRVADEYRGRVMTLYSMALLGGTPVGSLVLGSIAHTMGVSNALTLAATLVITLSAVMALNMLRLHKSARV